MMGARRKSGRRPRLPRGRELGTVSKSRSNELGWVFSDQGVDSFVVRKDVSASGIRGQVKGCAAILTSLAHMR